MKRVFRRPLGQSLARVFFVCAVLGGVATVAVTPDARADVVAYLVNVHMRPGYNFPNADEALRYGYGICDKVAAGRAFPAVMGDVRADFNTADDYQASYLISQVCQRTLPRADLAVAKLSSALQVAARLTPDTKATTCNIRR